MRPVASRLSLAIAACSLPFLSLPLTAQEAAAPDPYEWIVEIYPFPADELVRGFATEERGALSAPELPAADANDEATLDFLRKSNSVVAHYLKQQGLALPEGSVVVFDPVSLTLAARAPRITQSSIRFTSASFREHIESFIELNTVLLEGDGATIRQQLARAGETADHADLLKNLEDAVAQGTVTILKRHRLETRSGQRAKVDESREATVPSDLALAPDGMTLHHNSESYREGTSWEIDAVVGADKTTIDLNLALRHHFAPSQTRQIPFANTAKGTISSAVIEHSVASVTSQYTIAKGTTKLVGVWKPRSIPGAPGEPDRLQAAFLTPDLVEVLPLLNSRLSAILEKHADTVAKVPEGRPVFEKVADEIPEGMIVRRFRIPPTFLSTSRSAGAGASDPFADAVGGGAMRNEPTFTIKATAKDILASAGISFPAGSSANYLPENSTLVVRNTPENIALVEAYVMSIVQDVERTIGFTAYLVEGPAAKMREAIASTRGLPNHLAAWEILSVDPEVTHLSSNWIEGRSGQRCKVQVARDFTFPVGNRLVTGPAKPEKAENGAAPAAGDPPGTLSGEFEVEEIGSSFEIDPVLGADEYSVDVNFSIRQDYAEPTTAAAPAAPAEGVVALDGPTTRFHRTELINQSLYRDGMIRLVGSWTPEGHPRFDQQDRIQAVFLKIDVIPVQEEEVAVEVLE
jgi:hypothetical protein